LRTYKIKASQCSSSEALKVRKVDIVSAPLDEVAVCLRTSLILETSAWVSSNGGCEADSTCMTPLARRTSSSSPCSCAYCAIVDMRYFCPCLQMRLHRNLTHLVLLQYPQPSSLPRKITRPLSSCRPRVHHLVRRHVVGSVISESARFGGATVPPTHLQPRSAAQPVNRHSERSQA
jgi:hypothetical protein